jgi:hypothetical protein
MQPLIDTVVAFLREYLPTKLIVAFVAAVAIGYAFVNQRALSLALQERDYFRSEVATLREEVKDSGTIGQADSLLAVVSRIELGMGPDYGSQADSLTKLFRGRRTISLETAAPLLEAYRVMLAKHEQIRDLLERRRR